MSSQLEHLNVYPVDQNVNGTSCITVMVDVSFCSMPSVSWTFSRTKAETGLLDLIQSPSGRSSVLAENVARLFIVVSVVSVVSLPASRTTVVLSSREIKYISIGRRILLLLLLLLLLFLLSPLLGSDNDTTRYSQPRSVVGIMGSMTSSLKIAYALKDPVDKTSMPAE